MVLLVEDNMLIALEAEDMLRALGATSVVAVSTVTAAAEAVGGDTFDLAVLDVSVGQGTSFDFASRLRALEVPYIFASGYGDQVALANERSASIVLQKPYDREHLREAIRQLRAGVNRSQTATRQSE
jgi:CheY-like chemotaxis protein